MSLYNLIYLVSYYRIGIVIVIYLAAAKLIFNFKKEHSLAEIYVIVIIFSVVVCVEIVRQILNKMSLQFKKKAEKSFKNRNYDEAAKHGKYSILLNPRDIDSYWGVARSYFLKKDHDSSKGLYFLDKFIRHKSNDPRGYYLKGCILYNLKNYSEAENFLNKAIELGEKDPEIYKYLDKVKAQK